MLAMGSSQSQVAPAQPIAPKKSTAVASAKGLDHVNEFQQKPNDYELAIKSCKELEFILETEFASSGRNLHEMITNANASLPIELIMNMRYVATIGNNLVHEKSFTHIPDQGEFIKRYQRSLNSLKEIAEQRRQVEKRVTHAKRRKREAEIYDELMQADRDWLDRQQREISNQKAKKMAEEREARTKEELRKKEEQRLLEEAAKNRVCCACF